MPTLRMIAVLKDPKWPDQEIRLAAEDWNGSRRFDLRLYFLDKASKEKKPTHRGVVMSKQMLLQLREALSKAGESELHDLLAPPAPSPANQATTQGTPTAGTTTADLPGGG